MSANRFPYAAAQVRKGLWQSRRFLVLRRLAQAAFLLLFLSGPVAGIWISKGTLASSLTLGVLPLTDPFILLQSVAARHWPEATALAGAAIVLTTYLLAGGRSYCSWVCPINPMTDLAAWLRRRLGITQSAKIRPELRYYLVIAVLAVSAATGMLAFELVNPVTAFHRAIVYGAWTSATGAALIFAFDLLVAKNGWCGHLCPVGAFYGGVGSATLLRVSATRRDACDDCMDCFAVCPEPQVISPALRGNKTGVGPVILSGDCTVCGACIDACPERVFTLTHRFDTRLLPCSATSQPETPAAYERTTP